MSGGPVDLTRTLEGLSLRLHVLPRAHRAEVDGAHGGALRVRVKAPPVEDAANRAVVSFLSDWLGVPRSGIRIVSGQKSRDKRLLIAGLSAEEFAGKCGKLVEISVDGKPLLKR